MRIVNLNVILGLARYIKWFIFQELLFKIGANDAGGFNQYLDI